MPQRGPSFWPFAALRINDCFAGQSGRCSGEKNRTSSKSGAYERLGSGVDKVWKEIVDYVSPEWAPAASDICLVFGTRHGEAKFADVISEKLEAGLFDTVLLSGGATMEQRDTEAEVLLKLLLARGVNRQQVWLEQKAQNTLENVTFSRGLIQKQSQSVSTISILGKISSMRRYAMTVKRNWPEVQLVSGYPVNIFKVGREDWAKDEEFRSRVLGELDRIVRYTQEGDIEEI